MSSCNLTYFQKGQIFQIEKIDASVKPELYSLVDLMKDKYPGKYYRKQLTKAPSPNYKKDFFAVEKILKSKIVKKKKFYLVKYLFYPSKFNQYVPAENMKFGK